jgi:hypothetical protein
MASRMVMFYRPQVTQMNEEPASKSTLYLTLTHLHDENPEPREVCYHLEIDPPQV